MEGSHGGVQQRPQLEILAAVRAVAAETGASPVAVSLGWLLAQPQVSACIFGARSLAQLEENVKATDLALSAEQVARLDEASRFDLGYPYASMKDVQGRW